MDSDVFEHGETIGPVGVSLLVSLGIDIEHDFLATKKYSRFSAWGNSSITEKSYLGSVPDFSLLVNKHSLRTSLQKKVISLGADVRFNSHFNYSEEDLDSYSFIIDASGRARSLARKKASIQHYDRLTACSLKLKLSGRIRNVRVQSGLIEAYENGWFYHTTDHGGNPLIVCYTDAAIKDYSKPTQASLLIQEVRQYSKAPIIYNFNDDNIHSFHIAPASSTNMDVTFGKKWVAIGDARRTVDPISSQGVTNALADGIDCAVALNRVLLMQDGEDFSFIDQLNKEADFKFQQYMELRDRYYSMERRWPNSNFWAIRQI